jgi:hypothetical protein
MKFLLKLKVVFFYFFFFFLVGFLIYTLGTYNEFSVNSFSNKNVKIKGYFRDNVIVLSNYVSAVQSGIFRTNGLSSLELKDMTLIHSNTNSLFRNIIAFSSTGNFIFENCLINQPQGFIIIIIVNIIVVPIFQSYFLLKDVKNSWGAIGIRSQSCLINKCSFDRLGCGSTNSGGAFYFEIKDGTSCILRECNFSNCFAEIPNSDFSDTQGFGGGIFVQSGGNAHTGILEVYQCSFSFCSGNEGGAIYLKGFFFFF